jgi:thymidylate synthase
MVDTLKNNPNSRRILFHGWNVEYLPDETKSPQENARNGKQALPPCHFADSATATVKKHQQDSVLASANEQEVFLA